MRVLGVGDGFGGASWRRCALSTAAILRCLENNDRLGIGITRFGQVERKEMCVLFLVVPEVLRKCWG